MRMPVNPSMAMRPFQFSALAVAIAVAAAAAEAAHQHMRPVAVHAVGRESESGDALVYAGGGCRRCASCRAGGVGSARTLCGHTACQQIWFNIPCDAMSAKAALCARGIREVAPQLVAYY
jgi:hypothetical protein